MKEKRLFFLRKRVAKEAAKLLYTLQEKEFKQAKVRAAQTLGIRFLPSNLEVAEEIDKIADEAEGPSRKENLLRMRKEAFRVMGFILNFHPLLVGSVWRGTIHKNSDIDIIVFSASERAVLKELNNFKIKKTQWSSVTKRGKVEKSFHIFFNLPSSYEVEVVVRSLEDRKRLTRCEIYGDLVTGLSYMQLKKILEETPLQRFTPI